MGFIYKKEKYKIRKNWYYRHEDKERFLWRDKKNNKHLKRLDFKIFNKKLYSVNEY